MMHWGQSRSWNNIQLSLLKGHVFWITVKQTPKPKQKQQYYAKLKTSNQNDNLLKYAIWKE